MFLAIFALATIDDGTRWLLLVLFLFALALLLTAGGIALFTFVNIQRRNRQDH